MFALDKSRIIRGVIVATLTIMVSVASVPLSSSFAYAESQEGDSDGIIVVYEEGYKAEAEDILIDICQVEEVSSLSDSLADDGAAELITVDGNEDEALEKLNETTGVAFAQKNYKYELMDTNTNDSLSSSQYYLGAWDSSFGGSVGADVFGAWELITNPKSVTIAVIDTGCDTEHEDLEDNLLADLAYDAVSDEIGSDAVIDTQGHGTHVAGIAGAVANNSEGIAGTSGNLAKILPIKVFNGAYADTASIVKAMEYLDALMADGTLDDLHVINLSLGGYSTEDDDPALFSMIDYMRDKDVLTVCAGGNGSTSTGKAYKDKTIYPGDYDSCLCVTALDKNGNNSDYSDYNMDKDISAPGNSIISTLSSDAVTSKYGYKSGTSMATPIVSAVASMLWAYNDNLTVDQVVEAIEETANPVNTETNDRTGETGSKGAVDATAALEFVDETYGAQRTSISGAQISISQTEYVYDGKSHEPEINVTYNGKTLSEGQDYLLRYQNNKYPGTGTAIVSGKGEYKGTISTDFTIKQANIADATVTLSESTMVYNGKYQFPELDVEAFGETLKWKTDYTVSCDGDSTSVGINNITVTGKNKFTGTKTVSYKILPTGTSITKLTRGSKRFTVKWKSQRTQTSGYQIRYSLKSNMSGAKTVKVTSNKTTSKTVKKLKSKKSYYVQVRTYKNSNGKQIVSSWSTVKKIKTK